MHFKEDGVDPNVKTTAVKKIRQIFCLDFI